MSNVNLVLVILHFLGLALGFTASFASIVMAGLIAKAAPYEKAVLRGDAAAGARIESVGRVTTSLALTALVFAVLAFH
jgi:hypothetical protein